MDQKYSRRREQEPVGSGNDNRREGSRGGSRGGGDNDNRKEGSSGRSKSRKGILKNAEPVETNDNHVGNNSPAKPAHRNNRRNSSNSCGGEERAERGRNNTQDMDQSIYDTPKVPPVKWKQELAAAYQMVQTENKAGVVAALNTQVKPANTNKGSNNNTGVSFYENLTFANTEADLVEEEEEEDVVESEGIYDFPRPRNTDQIYINENFVDILTYDTPRKNGDNDSIFSNEDEIDCIECDYDVPKVREAILTPIEEEETTEYDVPSNNKLIQIACEEQLYENQHYANPRQTDLEPIYMNEMSDDRSSGYRSSSSPSIHSEENLYANESVALSQEELHLGGSRENLREMAARPERHDVAIETTQTLERQDPINEINVQLKTSKESSSDTRDSGYVMRNSSKGIKDTGSRERKKDNGKRDIEKKRDSFNRGSNKKKEHLSKDSEKRRDSDRHKDHSSTDSEENRESSRDSERKRNSSSRDNKKSKENGRGDDHRKNMEEHKDNENKEDQISNIESETDAINEEDDIWQTFDPSQVPKHTRNLEKDRRVLENGSFRKRQEQLNGSIKKEKNQHDANNKMNQEHLNGSIRQEKGSYRKSQECLNVDNLQGAMPDNEITHCFSNKKTDVKQTNHENLNGSNKNDRSLIRQSQESPNSAKLNQGPLDYSAKNGYYSKEKEPKQSENGYYSKEPETKQSENGIYSKEPKTKQSENGYYRKEPETKQSENGYYSKEPQTKQSDNGYYHKEPETKQLDNGYYSKEQETKQSENGFFSKEPKTKQSENGYYSKEPENKQSENGYQLVNQQMNFEIKSKATELKEKEKPEQVAIDQGYGSSLSPERSIRRTKEKRNIKIKAEEDKELNYEEQFQVSCQPIKYIQQTVFEKPENNNTVQKAKGKGKKERDRDVDVYNETVRQRTVRDTHLLSAELFEKATKPTNKLSNANKTNNTGLPSVRKLLARFENGQSDNILNPDQANTYLNTNGKSSKNTPKNILPETLINLSQNNTLSNQSYGKSSNRTEKKSSNSQGRVTEHIAHPANTDKFHQEKLVENKTNTFQHNKPIMSHQRELDLPSKEDRGENEMDENESCVAPLVSPAIVSETSRGHRSETPPHGHISPWDPVTFIKKMYQLPNIGQSDVEESDSPMSLDGGQSCPSIEGYMEKLPAGRKQATLWNSWKKHYFVASDGILSIYTNRNKDQLIDKMELFGGTVDFMDSNMLGLQDRRSQYIVVRCASHKAAQEWESALSFHTMEDFAMTFVTPAIWPTNPNMFTNTIVVDFGGSSVRAGICGAQPYLPQLFFPSLMAVNPNNINDKYFGFDALKPDVRSKCHLSHPLMPSKKVDKYSVDLVAICGLLLKVFKDLSVDPKKYELQLSVPRNFNDGTKAALASLLFDEFSVLAVNMGHQTVFALHSYRATTGIVVDIGERMDVVPIVAGYKVAAGASSTATGGMELATHLRHALLGRNYSLTSTLDAYIVYSVIERLCYVATNYNKEADKYRNKEEEAEKTIHLGSGAPVTSLKLGTERFEVSEGLFKPECWGLDQAGVHVLVRKAITECSLDVRKEMTQSIFLSGGLTLIPGFSQRLEAEIGKLVPGKPKVHASPYRSHASFLGAASHANTPAYQQTKVTRKDWVAGRANLANLWTL